MAQIMFPTINEALMRKGLEEALKYVINAATQPTNLTRNALKKMYSGISEVARRNMIDTTSYDITFSRRLEELK